MSYLRLGCIVVFFSLLFSGASVQAQHPTKPPKTWWPDANTGLMWTGEPLFKIASGKQAFDAAVDYCSTLDLAGVSGWRLPTLDEVKAATISERVVSPIEIVDEMGTHGGWKKVPGAAVPHDILFFRGGMAEGQGAIWTSTIAEGQSVWMVSIGDLIGWTLGTPYFHYDLAKSNDPRFFGRMCVRPIDPDLFQLVKEAPPTRPISSVDDLKPYVPLHKAQLAFKAGSYQESIAQAQNALQIKPNFAPAYWAMGLSYGKMGQWKDAVANLKMAIKYDKLYPAAKQALQWAQEREKAAKKGIPPAGPDPVWN